MPLTTNIVSIVVQAAYIINFLLGVTFLFGSLKSQRLLSALFFIMAFVPFQFELVYSKALFYYPHFFLTYIPAILLFGPLLYFFIHFHIFSQPLKLVDVIKHLTLPVVSLLAVSPIFLTPSDEKIALINSLYYESPSLEYHFLSILCVGSIFYYTWLLFQDLPTIQRAKTKTSMFFLLFSVTLLGIIFSTIGLASLLTHSLVLLKWGNLFFSLVILSCYCLQIRFDTFLPELLDELQESKKRKSQLTGINIQRALANLNHIMIKEKKYIDPSLSLASLAELIHLSTHQLSELLNHEIGLNFNSYVMEFRVKEAINLLEKEPNKTILSIALSVGFNSNSAFYTAFKKVTGKSPSFYRNE